MWIDGDALVGANFVKATSLFDLPSIRTLGKAFYWQRMIDTGEVANASELARSLKLEVGWVGDLFHEALFEADGIRANLDRLTAASWTSLSLRGRRGGVEVQLQRRRSDGCWRCLAN